VSREKNSRSEQEEIAPLVPPCSRVCHRIPFHQAPSKDTKRSMQWLRLRFRGSCAIENEPKKRRARRCVEDEEEEEEKATLARFNQTHSSQTPWTARARPGRADRATRPRRRTCGAWYRKGGLKKKGWRGVGEERRRNCDYDFRSRSSFESFFAPSALARPLPSSLAACCCCVSLPFLSFSLDQENSDPELLKEKRDNARARDLE
jgi:hypothetical protein